MKLQENLLNLPMLCFSYMAVQWQVKHWGDKRTGAGGGGPVWNWGTFTFSYSTASSCGGVGRGVLTNDCSVWRFFVVNSIWTAVINGFLLSLPLPPYILPSMCPPPPPPCLPLVFSVHWSWTAVHLGALQPGGQQAQEPLCKCDRLRPLQGHPHAGGRWGFKTIFTLSSHCSLWNKLIHYNNSQQQQTVPAAGLDENLESQQSDLRSWLKN